MLSSAQKASTLIKNTLDIIKETAAKDNIIEIQNIILALQEKNAALLEKNADLTEIKQKLEAKLMEYKNWDEISKKYSLTELAPGVFIYSSNPEDDGGEPRHNLCANCFQDKYQSILQRTRRDFSGTHYQCSKCGCKIVDHTDGVPYPDPI